MTTPTTPVTWLHGGLVHHALAQPRAEHQPELCDLLVACRGYVKGADSTQLRHPHKMVSCISCLGTNWEATVAQMDRDGLLTKAEALETDGILHRVLMQGGAFADSALRSNRR